jgi:hypothetical protein
MSVEQHKVVCHLHPIQQSQRHVYFQYAPDGDERREGVYMTRKVWNEMERPGVITVTIEIGDQIAEEEAHQQNVLNRIPNRIPGVNLAVGTEANPATP